MKITAQSIPMPSVFISFVVCFAAAAVGSLATRRAPEFYAALEQPPWAPPAWVFGPVWTLLYAMMAIAAWIVWKDGGIAATRIPLTFFMIQLVLNALWSWLFFAWRRGVFAELDIVALLAMIAITIVAFWRVRPLAGILMLPYFGWVAFATVLTFSLVQRNPDL